MNDSDPVKTSARPDCPREYHDDYAGHRPRRIADYMPAVAVLVMAAVAAGLIWMVVSF